MRAAVAAGALACTAGAPWSHTLLKKEAFSPPALEQRGRGGVAPPDCRHKRPEMLARERRHGRERVAGASGAPARDVYGREMRVPRALAGDSH